MILGPANPWIQTLLTICVIGPCIYAVFSILKNVMNARHLPRDLRRTINRWASVMIPPICSVGLLSLQLTISDSQTSLLIDAFILVNLLPAIYLLTQVRHFTVKLRTLLERKRA